MYIHLYKTPSFKSLILILKGLLNYMRVSSIEESHHGIPGNFLAANYMTLGRDKLVPVPSTGIN